MIAKLYKILKNFLPELLLQNIVLRIFGIFQIPLIGYTGARLVEVSDESIKLLIPHRRRNLNHMRSIYFGALAVGADLVVGYIAFFIAFVENRPLTFVFKGMKANFLWRAEEDALFVCDEVQRVRNAAEQTLKDGERVNLTVPVRVYQRSDPNKIYAEFEMELSLKGRKSV